MFRKKKSNFMWKYFSNFRIATFHLPVKSSTLTISISYYKPLVYKAAFAHLFLSPGNWTILFIPDSRQVLAQTSGMVTVICLPSVFFVLYSLEREEKWKNCSANISDIVYSVHKSHAMEWRIERMMDVKIGWPTVFNCKG
jgi:hypothetical protein